MDINSTRQLSTIALVRSFLLNGQFSHSALITASENQLSAELVTENK